MPQIRKCQEGASGKTFHPKEQNHLVKEERLYQGENSVLEEAVVEEVLDLEGLEEEEDKPLIIDK